MSHSQVRWWRDQEDTVLLVPLKLHYTNTEVNYNHIFSVHLNKTKQPRSFNAEWEYLMQGCGKQWLVPGWALFQCGPGESSRNAACSYWRQYRSFLFPTDLRSIRLLIQYLTPRFILRTEVQIELRQRCLRCLLNWLALHTGLPTGQSITCIMVVVKFFIFWEGRNPGPMSPFSVVTLPKIPPIYNFLTGKSCFLWRLGWKSAMVLRLLFPTPSSRATVSFPVFRVSV